MDGFERPSANNVENLVRAAIKENIDWPKYKREQAEEEQDKKWLAAIVAKLEKKYLKGPSLADLRPKLRKAVN